MFTPVSYELNMRVKWESSHPSIVTFGDGASGRFAHGGDQNINHINISKTATPGTVVTITITSVPNPSAKHSFSFTIVEMPDGFPAITQDPVSVTTTAGRTATFSITATGDNLEYFWQRKNNTNPSWENVEVYAYPSYTVTATSDKNGYQYRCRVSNRKGDAYSNPATLTVTP